MTTWHCKAISGKVKKNKIGPNIIQERERGEINSMEYITVGNQPFSNQKCTWMADNSGHFDHSRNKNWNKKDPNISFIWGLSIHVCL